MRAFPIALAAAATLSLASPARAQRPEWDAARHMLIISSALDSSDAWNAIIRAFQSQDLAVDLADAGRGRILSVPRPSDSLRSTDATVVYAALIHRAEGGGCEIWLGGLINARNRSNIESSSFARARAGAAMQTRPEGDVLFITPVGGSLEWRRMERIGRALAEAR